MTDRPKPAPTEAGRQWIDAGTTGDLAAGTGRVIRTGGDEVALFRLPDQGVFAVDNRCPHEGYPLARGYVTDCVLTCPWHNFKFDLRDGRCVTGDEEVRTYPVRITGERIEIDVTPPDPAALRARLWRSLEIGVLRGRLGQVCRDAVRLLAAGAGPDELALAAARLDATYGEYGPTHATPEAVDGLALARTRTGEARVAALMQALELVAERHVRGVARPVAAPVEPGADPVAAGERLRALVEAEDLAGAQGLLRGALQAGWTREVIEPWLYRIIADHFLDFGHALIYHVKIFALLETVGWAHADALLPAQLAGIVLGTREDTLPEWQWLRKRLDALSPLPAFEPVAGRAAPDRVLALAARFTDGTREEAFDAMLEALRAGDTRAVIDAISLAAAERILRFDVAIDSDPTVQEGWLDVTHTLTFANALRHAARRFREPGLVRLLAYGVRFANHARALDAAPERRLAVDAVAPVDVAPRIDVAEALALGEAPALAAAAAGIAASDGPEDAAAAITEPILDAALADHATRPIVVAHVIKTAVAAAEEHRALAYLPIEQARKPLLAAARLAAAPVRERPLRRLVHEAIRFVEHGKVPRTLT